MGEVLHSVQPVKKVEEFKYLKLLGQINGEIDVDVTHGIRRGSVKWEQTDNKQVP